MSSHFYKTQLRPTLKRIDAYVIRWARRKFKRMRHQTKGARDWPATPGLPNALCSLGTVSWQRPNIGSRVTREGHARFWERPEVKFLRATRQSRLGGASCRSSHVRYAPLATLGPKKAACRDGPTTDSRSAANKFHHSITSSARTKSVGGMVNPSALAVFRLMTSSNLTVCWTGRSAGLAPLRIFPT